ncbi:MAG: DUF1934 domain-containing protein [Lachnospiraceae bacterium]|nr:DUF1934 domain-containing protein [Lachnospiraceae bacterium]
MTKDVLISVEGLHFNGDEDPAKVEIINAGSYYKKNDYHYVLYDEAVEGSSQITKNMIKFRSGEALMHKKGFINADMLFEENKRNTSCYVTPFGDIMLDINTNAVDICEEDDSIRLSVDYDLQANYEQLANCRISVLIRPIADVHEVLGMQ